MVCAGIAPATLRAYSRAFVLYQGFCHDNGAPALPAQQHWVALFMTQQATEKGTIGAVTAGLAAVQFATKACGYRPLPAPGQLALIVSAARSRMAKTVKRRAALSPAMVKNVVQALLAVDVRDPDVAKLGLCIAISYLGGARFSDLANTTIGDITESGEGLDIVPKRRKNDASTARSPKLREMHVARCGGKWCVASRFGFFKRRFGWSGAEDLCPFGYDKYLRKMRQALELFCGINSTQAKDFGTHSGRRGAAVAARRSGAEPRSLKAFAGVLSDAWEDIYADTVIPEERAAVSRQLGLEVAAA